ncbi:citrate/2-methylcitrate synthase [Variovorax ginsengisoli]|uniref:citrate synthase (unknown stereospecificity) n=1 Tax=Variovorax ginsengisoli TaxID=363844 RepID=A0ABT8SE90_9BURK|nr:citrate/2-methylcitrate synthase [Variovorax ginsengisoli]MDN8617518.1 citrate/2-methylcitrate synthase [Variovorax ginsengisoli]MDO1536688.1 citrate/2-methylcitrate synthase [Variovorax ginsengisoli]
MTTDGSTPPHFFPSLGIGATAPAPHEKYRRRSADVETESVVSHSELMTSLEAMEQLGVKRQTLYAYVSRGLIRTAHAPGASANLYFREDVEAVGLRGRLKGALPSPAERALKWGGSPVLESAITRLTSDGPQYRGLSVLELATSHCSFERCAELLWTSKLPVDEPRWSLPRASAEFKQLATGIAAIARRNRPLPLLVLAIESYGASLGDGWTEREEAPAHVAQQLIAVLAAAFGLLRANPRFELPNAPSRISELLLRSAGAHPSDEAVQAVDAALVLCADHELATATFVTRISASVGANLLSSVTGALSSFEGLLVAEASENLLRGAGDVSRYIETLAHWQADGKTLPGYSHPAYLVGDPRGRFLMDMARSLDAAAGRASRFVDWINQASRALSIAPNVGLGLLAMCDALALPSGTAGALLALSRTAGWIAHAFEQRESGYIIRPRSRFVEDDDSS